MARIILTFFYLTGSLSLGWGQTCCSGGVPLSSNLGLPAAEAKHLQLALSYDLNVLTTLKEGRTQLKDQSRNRTTHSALWEIGYSISNRFSADLLFSYVRQERTIRNDLNENFVHTQGFGDAVILVKYLLWQSKDRNKNWTIALGSKLPTGAADKTNEQAILLNADLQPGSGAWDAIFWSQYTQTGIFRPSMGFFGTLTHSRKGINDNYLPIVDPGTGQSRAQSYQFGNEWQWILGLSDRLLLGKMIVDPGLSIRFRAVSFDRINEHRLPSTGGSWWFINPNFTYWPNDHFSMHANVEVPLYANITGTQLSPTFRLNFGLFYRLSLRSESEVPFINPIF